MERSSEALWKVDSVMVHAGSAEDGASFFCTGAGYYHSLCEYACESLARAVASCMCVVTMKVLSGRSLAPDQLKVKARVRFAEASREAELDSIYVNVVASGSALTADTFREIVEDARAHCPICRLLEQRVSIEAMVEPELQQART
ncbi:MAG: OsmC family protein [Terriglobia bacterium]|jgi:uncharacterized OsmC-like protein|nr:OsmC family protein [Terriglobia bacterium]